MKTTRSKSRCTPFFPVLLWAAHLLLLGVVVWIVDHFNPHEIEKILKIWVPWNFIANLVFISVGLFLCRHDICGALKKLRRRRVAPLLLLPASVFVFIVWAVPATHRIYYDEDIYINTAQTLAYANRSGFCNYGTFENGKYQPHWIAYNKQPAGWPFLISLVFRFMGTREMYAFFLNIFVFCGSIIMVYLITRKMTADGMMAFVAALVYAVMPHNLIWANTAAAEHAAAFFTGLTILLAVIFLTGGKDRHLFLLSVCLPFAAQMRPESILIYPLILLCFVIISPGILRQRKIWIFAVLAAVFILPHLLHLYTVSGQKWGADHSKFSMLYFGRNFSDNGLYFLNHRYFPTALTVLAAIGLLGSSHLLKFRILTATWFIFFWGVFIFFYAGSYGYGADDRFALLAFMPLAVLAGLGSGRLRDKAVFLTRRIGILPGIRLQPVYLVILAVIILEFVYFLPFVRQTGEEAWASRHDHLFAEKFIRNIPQDAIVLTHNPTMFLNWGQGAIQAYTGIAHPDHIRRLLEKTNGHVYFHHDYWCNTDSKAPQRLCRAISEKYELIEVGRARERDYTYGLFQMRVRNAEETINLVEK